MSPDSSIALSTDDTYTLMSTQPRRETVRLLLAEPREWSVEALATKIAARIHETDVTEGDETARKRIAVTLLHRDLPKLATKDIVKFDFETRTVSPGEQIDDLAPLVDIEIS